MSDRYIGIYFQSHSRSSSECRFGGSVTMLKNRSVMISIPLLVLVGVSLARHISYYDNATRQGPIISGTQERRICAELCMSGLGGEPCGDECSDVIPQGLPESAAQSSGDRPQVNCTRRDACPLLCANHLGYPLCGCNYTSTTTPFFRVNFLQICSHFCLQYKYRIYGCDECAVYADMTEDPGIVGIRGEISRRAAYDWDSWCLQMCKDGDGGSACYCDLLPFALRVPAN